MKTIGIYSNKDRDIGYNTAATLAQYIRENGGHVLLPYEIAREIRYDGDYEEEETVFSRSDVIVCLGGDGTFLKIARKIYPRDTPILGINLGNLGFLTEVDRSEMNASIDKVLSGNYKIEERMTLEAVITRNGEVIGKDAALNDIVISRVAISRILHIKTYINNVFVDSFPGDGLIVSSPTGSTAYSLSAGGPIVEPDIDLIIVTPICPHILYSRSFITTGGRTVKAVVDEKYEHTAMVTVDGQQGYEIRGGDCLEVRKAVNTIKFVKMSERSFFNVLRTKIYYRGENLRKDEI